MAPKKYDQYREGEWGGKALIRDKQKRNSAIVNLKVKAVDGEKLRLDVTSPLGSHLATMLVDKTSAEVLIVADKTVYQSANKADLLKRLIRVPLDAGLLHNVFFEREIADKDWVCARDERKYLKECKDSKSGVAISWLSRMGPKRTIGIENGAALVQINLSEFDEKISHPENAFELKVPAGFKTRKL